jgi:hypothetical protein
LNNDKEYRLKIIAIWVTAIFGFLGTVVGAVVTVQVLNLNIKAAEAARADERAAKEVRDVKQTLHDTTASTDQKLDKIHTLVNSKLGAALKLIAEYARSRAEQSGTSEHMEAALAAEEKYREHQEQQADVDAQLKKP